MTLLNSAGIAHRLAFLVSEYWYNTKLSPQLICVVSFVGHASSTHTILDYCCRLRPRRPVCCSCLLDSIVELDPHIDIVVQHKVHVSARALNQHPTHLRTFYGFVLVESLVKTLLVLDCVSLGLDCV